MGVIGVAMASVLAAVLAAEPPLSSASRPDITPDQPPAEAPIEPLGPPTTEPYVGRAAAEGALAFGASVLWYYRDPSLSVKDIDYNWSLKTWRKRLITFQAVRFDDNAFAINTVLHPSSGLVLYLIARGNRLGPVTSFLLTTAASTLWEFLVEYREVASINDLIITPVAGATVGEPLIRASALLRAGGASAGPINMVVAAILDPIGALNRAFEPHPSDAEAPAEIPTDRFGIPVDYRHRLTLGAGLAYADFQGRTRSEGQIVADLFVDSDPQLGSRGRRTALAGPGALTYLTFWLALGDAEVSGARLASKVAVLGRHLQAASGPDDVSITRESDVFLGLGTGFEYYFRTLPALPDDFLGVARLLGPLFDWGLRQGKLRLHVEAAAFYDFALAHALALADYTVVTGTDGLPRVLWQHGYYYAQGLTASARVLAQYDRWEAG